MAQAEVRVDILLFDDCIAAEAFGMADVLQMANTVARLRDPTQTAVFDVAMVSIKGRSVRVSAGPVIACGRPSRSADVLVVPGFAFSSGDALVAQLDRLGAEIGHVGRQVRRRRCCVASICVGAYVLAEAGLLAKRRATTAWIVANQFARRYPDVGLDLDQMLVRDGPVWTTAAVTAAYDLALALVREHAGAETAALLAKIILVGQDRHLQTPFVLADLGAPSRSDLVTRACHLLRREVATAFDLGRLAQACATSKRTLNRRFRAELGCSPLEFCHRIKVERAKALLETTKLRVSQIPGRLGYADETTFRAVFTRATGLTPSRYRERFRRPAAAPA